MPSQTNERAFETYAEEILLTRGRWRFGSKAPAQRLQECRTALAGRIDVRTVKR